MKEFNHQNTEGFSKKELERINYNWTRYANKKNLDREINLDRYEQELKNFSDFITNNL